MAFCIYTDAVTGSALYPGGETWPAGHVLLDTGDLSTLVCLLPFAPYSCLYLYLCTSSTSHSGMCSTGCTRHSVLGQSVLSRDKCRSSNNHRSRIMQLSPQRTFLHRTIKSPAWCTLASTWIKGYQNQEPMQPARDAMLAERIS